MEDTHVHALDYLSVSGAASGGWLAPSSRRSLVGVAARAVPAEGIPVDDDARRRRAGCLAEPGQPVDAVRQPGTAARAVAAAAEPADPRAGRGKSGSESTRHDAARRSCASAITITVPEPVATTNEPRRLDAFVVSYADAESGRAQRIANRLASRLRRRELEDRGGARRRTRRRSSPRSWPASQARLTELEARLRSAKESHMGQLPEQTQANLQMLSGLRQQLESNATDAARRAGSPVDDRAADRRDRQGHRRRARATAGRPTGDALAPKRACSRSSASWPPRRRRTPTSIRRSLRLQDELATAQQEARPRAAARRPIAWRSSSATPAYRQLGAIARCARCGSRELDAAADETQRQIGATRRASKRRRWSSSSWRRVAARLRPREAAVRGPVGQAARRRRSPRTSSATAAASSSRCCIRRASRPSRLKPMPLRVMLARSSPASCLGAAPDARPRVPRPLGPRRARAADEFDLPVLGEIARTSHGLTAQKERPYEPHPEHPRQGRARRRRACACDGIARSRSPSPGGRGDVERAVVATGTRLQARPPRPAAAHASFAARPSVALDRAPRRGRRGRDAAAEQYRALRTRIVARRQRRAGNVILVTSPARGEGKT